MRTSLHIFALIALSVGTLAANAQTVGAGIRYRWVDGKGLPHFSDSLNAEAVNAGYDIIDEHGYVAQHVAKPLSPAERAAADQKAAAQAAQEKAAAEKTKEDSQLLNAYPDEPALKSYQQGVLDNIDQQMKATKINLRSQDGALTDLLNRAADDERSKNPIPKFITDEIAKQRAVVAGEHAQLAHQQAARDAMVQSQAQDLQHYRDLKAAEAKGGN